MSSISFTAGQLRGGPARRTALDGAAAALGGSGRSLPTWGCRLCSDPEARGKRQKWPACPGGPGATKEPLPLPRLSQVPRRFAHSSISEQAAAAPLSPDVPAYVAELGAG